jgi:hypothetical protein
MEISKGLVMQQCNGVVAAIQILLASSQMWESGDKPASIFLEIKSCLLMEKTGGHVMQARPASD